MAKLFFAFIALLLTMPVNLTESSHHEHGPSWSPDGRRIAFVRNTDTRADIYVVNADGTERVRLTNHPRSETSPVWSPDREPTGALCFKKMPFSRG